MKSRKFLQKFYKMAKKHNRNTKKRRIHSVGGGPEAETEAETGTGTGANISSSVVNNTHIQATPELSKNAEKNAASNFHIKASQSASAFTETAANAATITAVGQMSVVGLSATGVGLPVAGILAITLLLANKLMNLMVNNLIFVEVLYDTINIITNYYLLYDFIEKRNFLLQLTLFYKNTPEITEITIKTNLTMNNILNLKKNIERNEIVDEIQNMYKTITSNNTKDIYIVLNEGIKQRIVEKLSIITKTLLELSPNDIIKILHKDRTINAGLTKMIHKEFEERHLGEDKNKLTSRISRNVGKLQRRVTRFTSSKYYQDIIIKDLTIMGNYFMLLKSQQDEALLFYKQKLKDEETIKYSNVWQCIENQDEYKKYLVTPSINEILSTAPITKSSSDFLAANVAEKKKQDINVVESST